MYIEKFSTIQMYKVKKKTILYISLHEVLKIFCDYSTLINYCLIEIHIKGYYNKNNRKGFLCDTMLQIFLMTQNTLFSINIL